MLGAAALVVLLLVLLTGGGDDEDAPAKATTPQRPELPGGGRVIFPDRMVVATYGAPNADELGDLGIGSPKEAGQRLLKQAKAYDANGRPVFVTRDAVTAALKTAVLATGRCGVLAFTGAYHGLDYAPLAACGFSDAFRAPFARQLNPHVVFAPYPSEGEELAASMSTIEACIKNAREPIGAVLVEPLLGRVGKLGVVLAEPAQPDDFFTDLVQPTLDDLRERVLTVRRSLKSLDQSPIDGLQVMQRRIADRDLNLGGGKAAGARFGTQLPGGKGLAGSVLAANPFGQAVAAGDEAQLLADHGHESVQPGCEVL